MAEEWRPHPLRAAGHAYKWLTQPVTDDTPMIGATWPKRVERVHAANAKHDPVSHIAQIHAQNARG